MLVILFTPIKWYWYVWCIIMYYVIFYTADYLSKKYRMSSTIFLVCMLMLYYIVAFNILGPTLAHYYRLTWAFLFGHLFAKWNQLSQALRMGSVGIGLVSFYFESLFMILSFVLAILVLLWTSSLNKRFDYKGKPLLYLGSISYFFYLSHRRIG